MNKCYEVYFIAFKSSVGAFKIVIWICKLSQYFGSTARYFSTKQTPFHRSSILCKRTYYIMKNACSVSHRSNWSVEEKNHALALSGCQTPWPSRMLLCPPLISPASCTNRYPAPSHEAEPRQDALRCEISSWCKSKVWDGLCKCAFYGSLMWTVFPCTVSWAVNRTKILGRSIEFVLIHLVHYSTHGNLLGSNHRMKTSRSCTLISVKPLELVSEDSIKSDGPGPHTLALSRNLHRVKAIWIRNLRINTPGSVGVLNFFSVFLSQDTDGPKECPCFLGLFLHQQHPEGPWIQRPQVQVSSSLRWDLLPFPFPEVLGRKTANPSMLQADPWWGERILEHAVGALPVKCWCPSSSLE